MPRRPGALARERERHAAQAPARFRRLYETLTAATYDHVLVGQPAILAYLHHLALRRPNGHQLRWRAILRWHAHHDFPLLYGSAVRRRLKSPPLTSTHAVLAWVLTRFSTYDREMFRVLWPDESPKSVGKRPLKRPRNRGVGKGNWTRPLITIEAEALLDMPAELPPLAAAGAGKPYSPPVQSPR